LCENLVVLPYVISNFVLKISEMERVPEEIEKLSKRLRTSVYNAVKDYKMIEPGDKVMVCLSGGKDSYTMLDILMTMAKSPLQNFEIIAVNLDQKQPGYPEHILPDYLDSTGVAYHIEEKDTYSIVMDKLKPGKTMCSLCSRLRRGSLYDVAKRFGATKIALGHHREDILETFFLNLFFAGKIETMPPKFITDDKENVVIRPLAYCKEADIEVYSQYKEFPIIPCNLCGSQPKMQRQMIKQMIKDWSEEYKDRPEIMFTALKNVHPSHMLDHSVFDFENMEPKLKYRASENKDRQEFL
jgi:tRNA 2-thiocytidine biosynthesis protein TtcA